MAAGADAVKAQVLEEFGAVTLEEGFDQDSQEVTLHFNSEGLDTALA